MSIKGKAEGYVELRGSLSLPDAIKGQSAYEIALINGFVGTEQEWLESLRSDFEAERIKAERERVAAEKARVEAEAKREAVFDESVAHFDAERDRAVAEFTKEVDKLVTEEIIPDTEAKAAKAANEALDATVEAAKKEVTYHTDQEKARATKTIDTKTQQALATLDVSIEALDTREELVWTNPSPKSSFTEKDITIANRDDYESFRIEFYENNSISTLYGVQIKIGNGLILRRGETGNTTTQIGESDGSTIKYIPVGRSVSVTENGIISIKSINSGYNNYVIPYKIYGIKNEKVELSEAMVHDTLLMRDANTDTMYKLRVVDGKLTIEGVE